MSFLNNSWQRFSRKQKIVGLLTLLVAIAVTLAFWGRARFLALETPSDSATVRFALNITIKERVNGKLLPAQGFVVIKPGCTDSKQSVPARLYLAQGQTYCTVQSNGGPVSIDSAFFTSTRQNKLYRLPLAGEKSLSKFWIPESLDIEAIINSDGSLTLTSKPVQKIRL